MKAEGAGAISPSHLHSNTNLRHCQGMKEIILFLGVFFICIGIAKLIAGLIRYYKNRKD